MNKLQRSQDPHGWADTVEARLRMLAVAVLVLAGVTACATTKTDGGNDIGDGVVKVDPEKPEYCSKEPREMTDAELDSCEQYLLRKLGK